LGQERDFKGVWISKDIYLDDRLTALEKIVLAEIDSLDGKDGCFCSNEYLAEFCQCGVRTVSQAISKLIELGLVKMESFDGRTRILRSCIAKSARQTSKNCEADSGIHYISNNIDNNISCASASHLHDTTRGGAPTADKGCRKGRDAEVNEFFERAWAIYPRKRGKAAVSKKAKAEIFKAGWGTVKGAIEKYKAEIERLHIADQYIMQGSTFFNTRWVEFVDEDADSGGTPDGYVRDINGELFQMPVGRPLTADECERLGRSY